MVMITSETCRNTMEDEDPLASQRFKRPPFFACYLLCSMSPRFKGCTYIGFTINPRRRIRQHNGEITCGAWQTKKKRPWEMILCIYGFPSQVSALQFEWAWQHPNKSLAVRDAAKGLRSLSGIRGKIMLAYTMLTLPEWKSLNLTVNFLSTKHINNTKGCPTLPSHIKVQICPVDDLPCYTDNWVSDDEVDLAEDHCSNKSDVSDPEDKALDDHEKQPAGIKNWQEKENDTQPPEKCRRKGCPRKQQKSRSLEDESGSEVLIPFAKELSLSSVQTNAKTMSERQNKLDIVSTKPNSLLQISDSEDSEDNFSGDQNNIGIRTRESCRIQNSSLSINLRQEMTYSMEDDWSIDFTSDCGVVTGSEFDKIEDILDNKLDIVSTKPNSLLQISDSEDSEDNSSGDQNNIGLRTRESCRIQNSSLSINLRQGMTYSMEDDRSIDFTSDCGVVTGSEFDKIEDILDNVSIRRRMPVGPETSEFNLSKYFNIDCNFVNDSGAEKVRDNMDDSINNKISASSGLPEFPSLQEYSPLCYISPLKNAEETPYSYITPCKSTPTSKPMNLNYSFLSPVASQCPIIIISSTPRPVSRGIIDLTDSPLT